MDPDFREQLYHAGRAMDAAGIRWSILSAFRDDYRQSIASGFKARTGNSLHGALRPASAFVQHTGSGPSPRQAGPPRAQFALP